MDKFKQFLEVYHAGFIRKMYGRENQADIYKNPSRKELHAASEMNQFHRGDGETAVWLHHKDMYAFDHNKSLHHDVKSHIGLDHKHEGIAAHVMHSTKDKEAHVTVTDSTRGSPWHHNPKIKKHIENHPELKKHFNKIHVNYYDEDIHGPWHEHKKPF